jgi:hypothetical protein
LRALNWDFVESCLDTQVAFNYFQDTFLNLFDIYFPLTVTKFNRNRHSIEPWMSRGLLISRVVKIKLCKTSIKSPYPANIIRFKNYRNLYNKLIKAANKQYYDKQFVRHQSNLKKTWSLIFEAIKKSSPKSDVLNEIVVNNTIINDPTLMANCFNEFFSSVALNIAEGILPTDWPPDLLDPDPDSPVFSFQSEPVTSDEIIVF